MEIYRCISAAVRKSKNTNELVFVELRSRAEWGYAFDVIHALQESMGGDVYTESSPLIIGHFMEAWRVHIYESRGGLTTRQVAELEQFEWTDDAEDES